MLLLIAIGAVILSCAGVYVATSRWSTPATSASWSSSGGGGEQDTLRVLQDQVRREAEESSRIQRAQAEERSRAQRLLATTRANSLLEHISTTRSSIQDARHVFARWGSEVPALLTSESGKRIASNPTQVETFAAIYNRARRPEEATLTAIENRLGGIEAEVQRVRETQDATLSEETEVKLRGQLERERSATDQALSGVQTDLRAVEALVDRADSATPAATTLEAALRELELEHAERRAEVIRLAVADVLVQSREQDAAMEARKKREITNAERRQREADLETERTRKDTAAEITEEKAKQERRNMLARSAEVQANYAPLLTKGKTKPYNNNPGGPGTMTWTATGKLEAQTVSLNDIKRTNALKSFEDFVRLLTSTTNDRGSWPPPASSDALAAKYRRRFEEFKNLAPLWLDMGLLRQ